MTAIYNLPLNSLVLIWRKGPISQFGYWSGPYSLLSIENKTYIVQFPHRPTNFCSMVVKPYLIDPKIIEDMQPEDDKSELLLPQTESGF